MSQRILFAWDFHGVLERDNEFAVQETMNYVLRTFGIERQAAIDDIRRLYGLPWTDYMKFYNPDGQGVWQDMAKAANDYGRNNDVPRRYIKPQLYASEVLGTIKQAGHTNIVVSNSGDDMVRYFTDSVGLTIFFDKLIGVDTIKADHSTIEAKSNAIASFDDGRFSRLVVIDDMEAGIQAGLSLGAKTYFFNMRGEFPKTNAHETISDLREVLKEL